MPGTHEGQAAGGGIQPFDPHPKSAWTSKQALGRHPVPSRRAPRVVPSPDPAEIRGVPSVHPHAPCVGCRNGDSTVPAGWGTWWSPLCHPTITLRALPAPEFGDTSETSWGGAQPTRKRTSCRSFSGHYEPRRLAPHARQARTGRTPAFPGQKGGFGEEFGPGAASHQLASLQAEMRATAGTATHPQAGCHTIPPTHTSPFPAHPRLRFPSIILLFLQQAPRPATPVLPAASPSPPRRQRRCFHPPPPPPSPFSRSILNFYCILFKEYRGTNALISNSHKV